MKKTKPLCEIQINYVDINDFDDDVKFGLKFKEFLQKEGYSYCVNMFNHYTIYKEIEDGEEDS